MPSRAKEQAKRLPVRLALLPIATVRPTRARHPDWPRCIRRGACAMGLRTPIIGRAMKVVAARSPVILIVDPDPQASNALGTALARRSGQDYRIETARSAATALHLLGRLADDHQDVALVAAELVLDGVDGVEFTEQAHVLHPRAMRALLLAMDERGTRIPFGAHPAVQRATALGRIDLTLLKGG